MRPAPASASSRANDSPRPHRGAGCRFFDSPDVRGGLPQAIRRSSCGCRRIGAIAWICPTRAGSAPGSGSPGPRGRLWLGLHAFSLRAGFGRLFAGELRPKPADRCQAPHKRWEPAPLSADRASASQGPLERSLGAGGMGAPHGQNRGTLAGTGARLARNLGSLCGPEGRGPSPEAPQRRLGLISRTATRRGGPAPGPWPAGFESLGRGGLGGPGPALVQGGANAGSVRRGPRRGQAALGSPQPR
jgi:hypothetical protein